MFVYMPNNCYLRNIKIASDMKKLLLLLLFALALPGAKASAQKIVYGQRVPELKVSSWLAGQTPQASAVLTYVEFFHSSNSACISSVKRLSEINNKLDTKLRIVVLTQEKEDKIAPLLTTFLTPDLSVGFDPEGKIFTAFGVDYVPFGVLLDAKNRVLWMGNTLQLTPETIKKSSK